MAQTYFNLDRNYIINHYRFKPIRDGFLLTNDFGSWVYLTKEEFTLMRHNKLNQNQALLSLLKDKGFVITENNFDKLVDDFKLRLRLLFRGTYHHVIFLDDDALNNEDINKNIKTVINFIFQTPSREIIVKFKDKNFDNFEIIKKCVIEFKKSNSKRILFEIETDLTNFNNDILEFLIDNNFNTWIPIKNINFSEEIFKWIKELQRRHKINFYIDVCKEIIGKEQELIDFFVDNNFKSFFIRKTDGINKDGFIDFWKKIIDKVYNINKIASRIVIQELYTEILLRKIVEIHDVFYPELNSLCTGAIINQLAYTLKGEIYANEESVGIELFKIGNINSNYSDIISSEDSLALLSTSINGDAALEVNVYKPYIGACPVCNFLQSSNLIAHHPNQRTLLMTEMFDYLFEKLLFDEEFLRFI